MVSEAVLKKSPPLASQEPPRNLKFEREDWALFRTIEGLQQKAGVTKDKLTRLVMKELADNGLDLDAQVRVGMLPNGGYFVDDDGSGIEPEEVARLFSINRPMVSTKLLRLPTRGALGNGLRVVAGAVLASEGSLTVIARNKRIELRPERDGTTTTVSTKAVERPAGTRIEISFGPALPCDNHTLSWALNAIRLAGRSYNGNTSPWWYDTPQFHELLYASGDRPVRELISRLDGCAGAKAGEIVLAAGLSRALCKDITQEEAKTLLLAARENARQVNPKRFAAVGPDAFPDWAYACTYGVAHLGSSIPAVIPYVVEVWADTSTKTRLAATVNRTPITGDVYATRDGREINVFGCGLANTIAQAPKDVHFDIRLNITIPFMPITSDGKAPDLKWFVDEVEAAAKKAIRKAYRPESDTSQKQIVLDNLDDAIKKVSGNGEYRFNQRQLLYVIRPIVKREKDATLTTNNFSAIITDYESEVGEIPGMYREPRGSIYHPHRGETITLGTLMVEDYERPVWTFNKLVYIEKEGFGEAIKENNWAERNDCMLMSSKGFSTRAARDLVDKLAEHDEPCTIFCVHDADASGTMIYQTFQEATRARGARKINIVNLGLEPWEAIAMGLEVETVEQGKRRKPVADYVREREDLAPDGDTWEDWLQTHRIELNAMTTPDFIEWLDEKMADYSGKLIPPAEVLEKELAERIEKKVRATITERILREAGLENQVAAPLQQSRSRTGSH